MMTEHSGTGLNYDPLGVQNILGLSLWVLNVMLGTNLALTELF